MAALLTGSWTSEAWAGTGHFDVAPPRSSVLGVAPQKRAIEKSRVPTEKGAQVSSTAQPARAAPSTQDDLVVTGHRQRGSVVGNIRPERTFRSADIRAFGADNVETLLGAVASQTTSNRGRGDDAPVTLLNGRRVANFSEIARIPAEAIERMEILPEEVALKYGYRADQKVVNIVTLERYRSLIARAALSVPTRGDRSEGQADADFLIIRGDSRVGLGATYGRSSRLLERDRGVRQAPGMSDAGRFRTLLPSTERLSLNGVVGSQMTKDVSATVNGRYEENRSTSLLGLSGSTPLKRKDDRSTFHLGTTVNGAVGAWRWNVLANYDRAANDTLTLPALPSGEHQETRSTDTAGTADLVLSGPVTSLAAGPLFASVRAGVRLRDYEAHSHTGSSATSTALDRNEAGLQLNLDAPLLGTAAQSSPIGRLGANANVAVSALSDTSAVWTFGTGLNWSPIRAIGIIVSATSEQGAATLEQLGAPALFTPNVRTFDIGRGEVVDITQVTGGNPLLRNDERHVLRIGTIVRPLSRTDLTFSFDYVDAHIDRPISEFPVVTPALEAAFPDRFTRAPDGRLQRIDARPVNFASSQQRQLRSGINLTKPLGKTPPGMEDGMIRIPADQTAQMTRNPNGTFTFTPQPGSAFARNLSTASSRLFISLYHNWTLKDVALLRPGLPALDLLDGGQLDLAGRRRHEIELQAGAYKHGLGARLSAKWQSATQIGGATSQADRLSVADLTTVDLNLFANLTDGIGGIQLPRWLRGTRLSLDVKNFLDTHPVVRDRSGDTPLSYQSAYLDPLGRSVTFSLRRSL